MPERRLPHEAPIVSVREHRISDKTYPKEKPNMKKTIQYTIMVAAMTVCIGMLGCASTGNNFDHSKVSQIKKGTTSEVELVEMFGEPQQRGVNSEGQTTLMWMYVESTVKGESFIPYAGVFMGGSRSKNKTLNVTLLDGKVSNFNYSGGGMETRSNQIQDVPKK
jgi:hypothetical protein